MSVTKIDFGADEYEYSAHRNRHWLDKAANPRHPMVLRVYFAALGRRRVGGHAPFGRGELAEALVQTGGVLPDRRRISKAIRQCIDWGYLAEGSNAGCLIVPLDDVQGGKTEYQCSRSHNERKVQSHKQGCECPRCLKVSVLNRTHEEEVSVSRQDTLPLGVRAETDTSRSAPSSLSSPPAARPVSDARKAG